MVKFTPDKILGVKKMRIKLNEIEGFEELADYYYICRDGDVCFVEGKNGKVRKSKFEKDGYKKFGLYQKNGKQKWIFEHRLFAICFIPNPENKPVINHINNIRSDNLLSNLEWCTYSENSIHSVKQNRWVDNSGENHGRCKIPDDQVKEIFELRATGLTQRRIADLIGCSNQHISEILSGKLRKESTILTKKTNKI